MIEHHSPGPAEAGRYAGPAEAGRYARPAEAGRHAGSAEAGHYAGHAEAGHYAGPAEAGRHAGHAEAGHYAGHAEAGHYAAPADDGLCWVRVTACDNVPVREGRPVTIGGREIAIFNLGDRFLATDNRCPHQGGPLSDGIVTGTSVVCPLHAWKVSLLSGAVERPSLAADRCVATYPVRLENGIVIVGLPTTAGERPDAQAQPESEVAA